MGGVGAAMPGRIGPYLIDREIGRGGTGVVRGALDVPAPDGRLLIVEPRAARPRVEAIAVVTDWESLRGEGTG